MEDIRNLVRERGLVPVANGTTADLRWCVADGVTVNDDGLPSLVRYIMLTVSPESKRNLSP